MKKIVINTCYGGFRLSCAAMKHYLGLQGKECHFFKRSDPRHFKSPMVEITITEALRAYDVICTTASYDTDNYVSSFDIKRDDPFLIQTIEELGEEMCSAPMSELHLVEIPDDVDWYIDEYDGNEHVAEKHRTWR